MKHNLILVTLNKIQIAKAKAVNGKRKQISHALICGPHGQIFGTEKQCRKYHSVWVDVFPHLFNKAIETNIYEISDYESSLNLVNKLINLHDPLEKAANPLYQELKKINKKKKSLFARLFGK
jgi:hypothetical protein